MTYRGTVKNGVIVFDEVVDLEDGTLVKIEPIEFTKPQHEEGNELFLAADRAKPTGIPDLAGNHDHYLYGHPKEH